MLPHRAAREICCTRFTTLIGRSARNLLLKLRIEPIFLAKYLPAR